MAMYRFFQTGEESVWTPITDGPNVVEDAKRQGAKKLTILAVDKPLDETDARRGNSYKGPLYFDIDLPDVEHAIASALSLVDKLITNYQTPIEAIQIYASGKKGLHVIVDQRAFMSRRTAVKDLPLIYKAMATELYVSGLDLSPYAVGKNNTFRIANVKRYDGNYRVPLRYHELKELDGAGYLKMVAAPRHEVTFPAYEGQHSVALNMLYAMSSDKVARYEKELTERGRGLVQGQLQQIADHAPPCVEELAFQHKLATTATFNDVALNLALWAARAGVPEIERDRIFAMTSDNAEPSTRYPTARARRQELEGKYRFAVNSPEYKFGCGAMRSLVKAGRRICEGCVLENNCKSSTAAEFYSDMAERLGITSNESGYLKLHGKGKTEPISTFTLAAEASYMEDQPDGTGVRRRGTLCRVMRQGEELGQVVMDESSWSSKNSFLRALEGIPGVYYTGGDAEIQKIKMLVFIEEESMPEIYQVNAAGIHIDRRKEADVITYVEPGKSLNNLHMVDTHRLSKALPLPPNLFKQLPMQSADLPIDQTLANLCRSNEATTVAVILGWFVACHLKAHLRTLYGQFPLLSVWGAAGSGKSKMAELCAALFGMNCTERSKASCPTLNRFNAIELLSGTTSIPRLCEEYNKDKMPEQQYVMLGELFKALWNAEAAQRGTVVPGAGRNGAISMEIPLTAPAVLLSEQQPKMPALRERSLVVMMKKAGRRKDEFMKAWDGRANLMRLGQYLMQDALKLQVDKAQAMFRAQQDCVGDQWDDRPRYSLQVIHMALEWLIGICANQRLNDSVIELRRLKQSLLKVTQQPADEHAHEPATGVVLARREQSEIDLFLVRLNDISVESGAVIADSLITKQPSQGRRVWINPRYDYKVAGDTLYLWAKNCHSRFVEWTRVMGVRTPLAEFNDLKNLIEHEPYFLGWKKLEGFAFGEPALILSIDEMAKRGIDITGMKEVADILATVDLEA